MNLGINALGAYVHTNRLQYVEFLVSFMRVEESIQALWNQYKIL